jgi:hypothetical protein
LYKVYVYPILIGLFVPMNIYARNRGEVLISETFEPFAAIVAISLLIMGLARLTGRNMDRSAILLSLFWMLFFQFGRFNQLSSAFSLGRDVVQIAAGVLAALLVALVFWLRQNALTHISTWLFLTAAILSVPPAFQLARGAVVEVRAHRGGEGLAVADGGPSASPAPKQTRSAGGGDSNDIFYMILDGYGGDEVLERYIELDNAPFYRMLADRGFKISHNSRASYAITLFSLASTLNMSYLDGLADKYRAGFKNKQPLRRAIVRSQLFQSLKQQNYTIHLLTSSSHLIPRRDPGLLDDVSSYMEMGQYALAVVGNTPLHKVLHADRFFLDFSVDMKPWVPDSFDWVFERAAPLASNGRKDFVLVHVLAPHSPYYFDRTCALVPANRERYWNNYDGPFEDYRVAYREQLLCVNRMIEAFLDALQEGGRDLPIVIMQGDHGPPEITSSALERENIDEYVFRTSVLNVIHLPRHIPESVRDRIGDGITSVNTFRLLMSAITGEEMPLLERRSFRADYQ